MNKLPILPHLVLGACGGGANRHISDAIGGEELDISMCRLKLDDEFHLVKWESR